MRNLHQKVFYFLHLGPCKNCYLQKDGKFLTYTWNCKQKATIGTVKLTVKIPPCHNGVIHIKMSGPNIQEQLAYFLTDDNTNEGRNLSIKMLNGIYKIKDRKTIPIIVANYTNKHITFTKGEYIGQFEPAITEDPTIDETVNASTDNNDSTPLTTNSIALKKMLAEQVQPDTFQPSLHTLSAHIQKEVDTLLQEYKSQFAQDETSIGTTPLTSMTIDTGDSPPVSQ